MATYLGTVSNSVNAFILDDHHEFIKDKPMLVCGNTASMLENSRYRKHFKITGDRSTHFGPFECAPAVFKDKESLNSYGGACC